jgi:predicted cobalt transporter CbtA
LILPGIHEVPAGFPADVLWHFRVASLGTSAVLWATIGLGFGALAERRIAAPPSRRRQEARQRR